MSWDIVIFSSAQKITSVEEVNPDLFIPVDFDAILEKDFPYVIKNSEQRTVEFPDSSFVYYNQNLIC